MLVSVNDTAATDSYTYLLTRSLHDALPISAVAQVGLGALDHRQAPIFRVRRNQDRFISREQIGALIVQVLVCQDIIIETKMFQPIGQEKICIQAVRRSLAEREIQIGRASCRESVCPYG